MVSITAKALCEGAAGQIPFEEKYKDHSYVFLVYDVGIELKDDWSYITREHKQVKILKEDAMSMGEIPIPYNKESETFISFNGRTITPEGETLGYTKVQDVAANEGLAMYSDQMMKIVTVPAVTIGSVIDYESTVLSKGEAMKDQFWYSTDLNASVPIKEMTLTVTLPKRSGVRYKEFSLDRKPEVTEAGDTVTYRWHLEDLYDEDSGEDLLPPPRPEDFKNCITFSSTKSWKDVSDWYYGLMLKNMPPDEQISKTALGLTEGRSDVKSRTRAILEYIQDNFRYVAMSFGPNTLEPHPVTEVFRNRYGDCKDLSLLSVAMLKEAGIRANLALFRVESEMSDPQLDLPAPILFDHMVVEVEDPEGNFYIDPVLRGFDLGEYPLSYQGAYMFVITRDGGKFARMSAFDEKRYYERTETTMKISPDGSAAVSRKHLSDLESSLTAREAWRSTTDSDKEKFFENYEGIVAEGGKMLENRFENMDARYGPLTSFVSYEKPGMFPVADDLMILDVAGFKKGDMLTKKTRKNPIFFPFNSLVEGLTTITIPEGYKVLHLPGSFSEDMGFFSLTRSITRTAREIRIEETERYRRMELPASDYGKIQEFLLNVSRKSDQRIILQKQKHWWGVPEFLRSLFAKIRAKHGK